MATGRVPTTANSPLTAKGDLFTYSTAPARLAVGNSGEQLVADSAATTGLRYSATPSASNPVLNSAMQVWQRGTTFAISNTSAYTADRWQGRVTAVCTTSFSRQTTSDTTNLPNIQYATRVQRTSGQTALPYLILEQSFESVNSIPFAGKTVTLSFYARAGANFSAASSQLGIQLYSGTGTDQNISGAYTGLTAVVNQTPTLTTTWQRFTYSGSVASTATELAISMLYQTVGTAGAADYFEVTGFQIDIGSVALPFRTNGATIQGELSACQRYYWRYDPSLAGTTSQYSRLGMGFANSAGSARVQISNPTAMRTGATSLEYNANITLFDGVTAYAPTSLAIDTSTSLQTTLVFTPTSATMTTYRPYQLYANGSTAAYVAASAEL
jgi:hypothetical protein